MIILFALIALLLLIIFLSMLVFFFKKLPRKYFLLFTLLLITFPFIAYKFYERSFTLGSIPSALHVKKISYTEEQTWGFGPGGNEAGIRVFELSQAIADEITSNGIHFFNNIKVDENQRYITRSFTEWAATPVAENQYWKYNNNNKLDVYDYICVQGLCIDIEPDMAKLSNQIINQKGNFYSRGRIGLIIVSPSKKMVIYLYNG